MLVPKISSLARRSWLLSLGEENMKLELQAIVICALFGILGAAMQYQRLTFHQNQPKHSFVPKWLTILAAGIVSTMIWIAMNRLLGFLPIGWDILLVIIGLGLFHHFSNTATRPSPDMSPEETASARRIQKGIWIGTAIFLVFWLIVFWRK